MVVENGRGYIPATEHTPKVQEIGIIPVDAVYSPVVRVRYEIEETRVGQKTNYDKLTMEIWTNGSIGPEMALVEAAKILRKHLNPFVQYNELGSRSMPRAARGAASDRCAIERKLNMSLAELNLSVRATNCLESENIHTVRDLVTRTEDQLLEVRNFGETTLNEVREKLTELGLRLGMRLPASCPVSAARSPRLIADARRQRPPEQTTIRPCDIDEEAASSAAPPAPAGFAAESGRPCFSPTRCRGRRQQAQGQRPNHHHRAEGQGSSPAGREVRDASPATALPPARPPRHRHHAERNSRMAKRGERATVASSGTRPSPRSSPLAPLGWCCWATRKP